MKVLVTGATGFIGCPLLQSLRSRTGIDAIGSVRPGAEAGSQGEVFIPVGDLSSKTDWTRALQGIDAVIHTAASVHIMGAGQAQAQYREINTDATLRLAQQAVSYGVRRFVFLSTIKVNGERTEPGKPFKASDPVSPEDPYALSKYEAEQGLFELAEKTGLEVVVIRPPLVYGPGVRANFEALMRLVTRGVPLPLGGIDNRRSMIGLDNLIDLIQKCLEERGATNEVLLAADGEDFSTPELITKIANFAGKRAKLFTVPASALQFAARSVGQSERLTRLTDSLQVDIEATGKAAAWDPAHSVDAQLRKTVACFLEKQEQA